MIWRIILLLSVLLIIFSPQIASLSDSPPPYWHSNFYADVIDSLKSAGFTLTEIDSIFYQADSFLPWYPKIVDKFKKPKGGKNYLKKLSDENSELFSKASIKAGKDFLQQHYQSLYSTEKKYGVNKEIIVAIIRIESVFGKYCGEYYVFSVFNSIICSPDASDRFKNWAKKELVDFLIICRENNLNLTEIKGSYAGAIGFPQFLPSSYRKFAIDADNDSLVNLFDWDDTFASIANYLKLAGWRRNTSLETKKNAIYAYNHNNYYVLAVIKYARKIGAKI
jgi:membrane-bound lytic murein transglycosylase B